MWRRDNPCHCHLVRGANAHQVRSSGLSDRVCVRGHHLRALFGPQDRLCACGYHVSWAVPAPPLSTCRGLPGGSLRGAGLRPPLAYRRAGGSGLWWAGHRVPAGPAHAWGLPRA
eukprot:606554-Karenia_brevis.AAC.1